jgi:hypothetical protein
MALAHDPPRLTIPVRDRADVVRLDDDERRALASWLASADSAATLSSAGQRRRRRVLWTATTVAVVLVPWLAYLAVTLPDRHRAHEWRLAWVGFDVALVLGFAATAWFGWRSRQIVVTAFVVTATLLLCDAWFDVMLSWGGREQTASIVTAAVGEIPLALLLLVVYHRLVRALAVQIWRETGQPGEVPPLRRLPLLLRPTARTNDTSAIQPV